MEAHGGYLCRLEALPTVELVGLAREALKSEGYPPSEASLLLCALPEQRVLRLAFDATHTYGRRGAAWYGENHALARMVSEQLRLTVHAYVFDPEELEQVVGYGGGRRVGGDKVRYEDAELPEDEDGELDEARFTRLKDRWPLGHLAKVFGVPREALLRIPRAPTVLLDLEGRVPKSKVTELFPRPPRRRGLRGLLSRARASIDES